MPPFAGALRWQFDAGSSDGPISPRRSVRHPPLYTLHMVLLHNAGGPASHCRTPLTLQAAAAIISLLACVEPALGQNDANVPTAGKSVANDQDTDVTLVHRGSPGALRQRRGKLGRSVPGYRQWRTAGGDPAAPAGEVLATVRQGWSSRSTPETARPISTARLQPGSRDRLRNQHRRRTGTCPPTRMGRAIPI